MNISDQKVQLDAIPEIQVELDCWITCVYCDVQLMSASPKNQARLDILNKV